MTRMFRGIFILWVVFRHGLDELVLSGFQQPGLRLLRRVVSLGRNLSTPRGQRLREALESLGCTLGEFGVRDWFWQRVPAAKSPAEASKAERSSRSRRSVMAKFPFEV